MHQPSDPRHFLAQLAAAYRADRWPGPAALRQLLRLCRYPLPAIRETALTLLLHPPVADEPGYRLHLIQSCLLDIPRISKLPLGLIEALLEIVAHLQAMPDAAGMDRFFDRLLKNLPTPAVAALLNKPFALGIFMQQLPARSVHSLHRHAGAGLKPRWRLLRRTISAQEAEPDWRQTVCKDLDRLWHPGGLRRRYGFRRARWLRVGRQLKLSAAPELAAMPVYGNRCSARRGLPHWDDTFPQGPFSEVTRRYWQTLLAWQAEELRSVRTLAEEVSRNTRRVTLSWHNASLAAAGGWAFPALQQCFPTESLWREFKTAVRRHLRHSGGSAPGTPAELEVLWEMWQERLVLPKVIQALWEDRVFAPFHSSRQRHWYRNVQRVGNDLVGPALEEILAGDKYGWPEALGPHQRFPLKQILAWRRDRRLLWGDGLRRLTALIHEGQCLLNRGDLEHLVLPWIDKFFISSKRAADLEYLSSLVRWLNGPGSRPLVLFWDDTARASTPSLKLALQELRSRGEPVRGIGIFGGDGTRRQDAAAVIGREHAATTLFALRPRDDTHTPRSLQQLLNDRDYDFFRHYDSSWKDNLCHFYAGTQVFPLLAVQSERESLPAWIAARGFKYPFGWTVRAYLRVRVAAASAHPLDELDADYAWWANLD